VPAAAPSRAAVKAEQAAAAAAAAAAQPVVAKQKKLSYKDQRELDELPVLIASLEDEQAVIAAQLSHPDFYKKTPAEGKRLNARVAEIETQLLEALEKWEVIEARSKA
jgi:ATP-binding cassette subfamily F protein uup